MMKTYVSSPPPQACEITEEGTRLALGSLETFQIKDPDRRKGHQCLLHLFYNSECKDWPPYNVDGWRFGSTL